MHSHARPERPTSSPIATRVGGLVCLLLAILIGIVISGAVGTRDIALSTTWQAITSFDPTNSEHLLVVNQRVPRAFVAVLVGVGIGIAGAMMQALTRNPLAEPGLLGVNAGAALAIAMGIAYAGTTGVLDSVWFGLVGAAGAAVVVMILGGARRGTNPIRLVLAGAAMTVVLSAATQLVLINSPDAVFERYRQWMVGSLAGRSYDAMAAVMPFIVGGVLVALLLARRLDAALLGDDLGRALGSHPTRTWAISAVVIVALCGAATAVAGPITFLGLAAPHIARRIVGANHAWMLPYSTLVGATLILVADILGRVLSARGEIGVGIMVAIIGGPFFIALARRRKLARL